MNAPSGETAGKATIVVPCFNEAARLDRDGFALFAAQDARVCGGAPHLLFVDDGSTDGTRAALRALVADLSGRGVPSDLLTFDANAGKGEAVRRGMQRAIEAGADRVGYYDADLATPPDEMSRLLRVLDDHALDVALGARVALLGHAIERKAHRHYLGRVFATGASIILGLPVYDTQCGAKAFRATRTLDAALAEPFSGRWAFDVELIGRLVAGAPGAPPVPREAIEELPLRAWHDVGGSTLTPLAFPRLGFELARIAVSLSRWGKR